MKILQIILYPNLYPPINGGMLRCWNLAVQLSLYFNLDLLCLQPGIEKAIKEGYDGIGYPAIQYLAPAERLNGTVFKGFGRLKTAIKYRWYYKTLSPTNSLLLDTIPLLEKIKGNTYDIVLFEHLESLALRNKLKRLFPRAIFIMDAHNVDHIMLKDQRRKKQLAKIRLQETALYKRCSSLMACSDQDASTLRALNQNKIPVITIPNGIDTKRNSFQLPVFCQGKCNVIFCGSLDYEPNYKGLIWFLKSIWPALLIEFTFIKLTVVGKGNPPAELAELIRHENIEFIGQVPDVIPYYRDAHLAVVPLLHGSGTRLKILEAMSLGVPVISTSIGAEGIHYTNEKDIMIADTVAQFVNRIGSFINNPLANFELSKNARALVEKEYSWNVIGRKLHKELSKPIKKADGITV